MRLLRSMLFAPGNRPHMVERVAGFGADAVILDLEDAVPLAEKEATRPLVRRAVETIAGTTGTPVYVRVNPLGAKTAFSRDFATLDLEAVACPALCGVILPKAEAGEEVAAIDSLLCRLEAAHGMSLGKIELIPLVETARGVLNALAIAAARPGRVPCLAIGGGDLTLDLGIAWTRDETELLYARSHLVLASRAAGLGQPLDTIWPHIQDEEGLRRSARLVRQLGFQGKLCIHPRQVSVVNAVFSPSPEEVAEAQRVVEAFAQAERAGAASVQLDGRMIDYPIAARARHVLARAATAEPPAAPRP